MENIRIANGNKKLLTIVRVLGTGDKNGNFKEVKSKDRNKYLDELGNGANDDEEPLGFSYAWFIFYCMFYVILKSVASY